MLWYCIALAFGFMGLGIGVMGFASALKDAREIGREWQ